MRRRCGAPPGRRDHAQRARRRRRRVRPARRRIRRGAPRRTPISRRAIASSSSRAIASWPRARRRRGGPPRGRPHRRRARRRRALPRARRVRRSRAASRSPCSRRSRRSTPPTRRRATGSLLGLLGGRADRARRLRRGPLHRPHVARGRGGRARHRAAAVGRRVPVGRGRVRPARPRLQLDGRAARGAPGRADHRAQAAADDVARFGEALAATHDVEQLLRASSRPPSRRPAPAARARRAAGDWSGAATGMGSATASSSRSAPAGTELRPLVLERIRSRPSSATAALARRARGDRARERAPAPHRRAPGARSTASPASPTGATRDEHLAAELSRAERFAAPLAVVLADLDDFKRINDVLRPPGGRRRAPRVRADAPRVRPRHRPRRPLGRRGVRPRPARHRRAGRRRSWRSASGPRWSRRPMLAPDGSRIELSAQLRRGRVPRCGLRGRAHRGRRRGALHAPSEPERTVSSPLRRRPPGADRTRHFGRRAATIRPVYPSPRTEEGLCRSRPRRCSHKSSRITSSSSGATPISTATCRSIATRARIRSRTIRCSRPRSRRVSRRRWTGRSRCPRRRARLARRRDTQEHTIDQTDESESALVGPLARLRLGRLTLSAGGAPHRPPA